MSMKQEMKQNNGTFLNITYNIWLIHLNHIHDDKEITIPLKHLGDVSSEQKG